MTNICAIVRLSADERAAIDCIVRLLRAQSGEFFFLASKNRDGHFRDYVFSRGDGTPDRVPGELDEIPNFVAKHVHFDYVIA